MKTLWTATTVAMLLTPTILPATQNPTEGAEEMTEEREVHAAVEAMTAAFNGQDLDGILSAYEPGAVVVFEPGHPVHDPARIREMFEGYFAVQPTFSYPNGYDVVVAGDLALHVAPWHMEGHTPDGRSVEQSGLSVAILRKQEDGRWLLVADQPNGQVLLDSQ